MTNAEFAILSLIAENPRHGYEIEQVIETRGMREWTEIGFSSIYYLLKKLEREGLIKGKMERPPGKGPARKVYTITPQGREEQQNATLRALATPTQTYPPLQLGLANFPSVPRIEAIRALQQHRDAIATHLQELKDKQKAQQPLPDFVDAMFDQALTVHQAEYDWLTKFLQELTEHDQQD
jgi:DNA-binding PadR family transcriptional regulator